MDKDQEWMKRISMHDYVQIENNVYFFSLNFNGLYKMTLPERKLEFLGSAPNEGNYQKHLYGAIAEANGELYMPPMHGEEIAVYNLKDKSFEKIPLKYNMEGMPYKFCGALSVGGKIFFIPARYPYLVIIDTDSGKVIYLDDWRKKLNVPDSYRELYVKNGYFIRNNKLYMASMIGNCLIKISLDTYETEIVAIGYETEGFMDMCEDKDREHIWFIQKLNQEIIRWNEKTGECKIYADFPQGFKNNGFPFINIVCNDDKVCAIAYQSNMTIEIDKKTDVMSEAKWDVQPKEVEFNDWKAKHYFTRCLSDRKWLLANIDDNSFYITDGYELKEIFYLRDEYSCHKIKFCSNSAQKESQQYGLIEYLKFIVDGD